MGKLHRITAEDFQAIRFNVARRLSENGVAVDINHLAQRAVEEAYIKIQIKKSKTHKYQSPQG